MSSVFYILIFFGSCVLPSSAFVFVPVMSGWVQNFDNLNLQASKQPSLNDEVEVPTVPSMLITVGPQCSGKTTSMTRGFGSDVFDVTIDDQDGVYIRVGREGFIEPNFLGPKEAQLASDGKNTEQRLVLCRLLNNITSDDLTCMLPTPEPMKGKVRSEWRRNGVDERSEVSEQEGSEELGAKRWVRGRVPNAKNIPHSHPISHSSQLLIAVECYIENWLAGAEEGEDEIVTTDEIDVFDGSAIWPGGIEAAKAALGRATRDRGKRVVSWGNTNARYSDYSVALEEAERANRVVHFVKYLPLGLGEDIGEFLGGGVGVGVAGADMGVGEVAGGVEGDRGSTPPSPPSDTFLSGDLETLLLRNIKRFATTGRYIPCEAIQITLDRVTDMLSETMPPKYILENKGKEKFLYRWDSNLCEAAGFIMGGGRYVRKKQQRRR